jgi:DNA-binding NtrC family response regulator
MATTRILVIDDEPLIRWSFEQALSAAGYAVTVAGTAAEGLACLHASLPDVVFLDVRLPDADGLSILAAIAEEHAEDVAVIVMTAFGETYTAADARRLGAWDYLKKPFDFDVLDGIVKRAVARTRWTDPTPQLAASRGA